MRVDWDVVYASRLAVMAYRSRRKAARPVAIVTRQLVVDEADPRVEVLAVEDADDPDDPEAPENVEDKEVDGDALLVP